MATQKLLGDTTMSEVQRAVSVDLEIQPPVTVQAPEPTSIIHAIERAALDPRVDIDKMERLIQMQERIMANQARAAFMTAFSQMQAELPVIRERGAIKDRAGNAQSRYALWEDINEAIRPVLAKWGFSLSFRTERRDDRIIVTGILGHREGHEKEATMELPADTSGSKNAVQAIGSSTSYGKRYTAAALLNLTSRDDGEQDDDGCAAGGHEDVVTITSDQVEDLRKLLLELGKSEARFLTWAKLKRLEDIPASRFYDARRDIMGGR